MEGPTKDLGPCAVFFDGADLGPTFGGVKFKYNTEQKMIHEDQKGTQDVDGVFTGSQCEVEVPLTRMQINDLAAVLPGARMSSDVMLVEGIAGTPMLASAKELILKPIEGGVATTDESKWLTIPKAFPVGDLELNFDNDNQRVYKAVFKAFLSDDNLLFKIGE